MRRKSVKVRKKVGLKTAAAALATALLLGGCGGRESETVSGGADVEEETEKASEGSAPEGKTAFKIAVLKHTHNMGDDFNEQLGFQMAEEATGIHIEWISVSDGSAEKVNAMLTADLPDAFLGLVSEEQIASSMDSFADLSGILEENAPHVMEDYKTIEGGMDLITWPDGSIRALMTGDEVSYANDAMGITIINKKWLDQLGMDIPTTMEEFYEVLCAFRDNDMNGNGDASDEIPLKTSEANWCAGVMNMANPWGIGGYSSSAESHYFMVKDGKAIPTMDTDAYRGFLEYMHRLVQEGLYDVESFTETNDQFFAKLKSGVVGVAVCWSPYAMMSDELAEQYVVLPFLNAEPDYNYVKSGRRDSFQGNKTGFAITSACENPEKLLEWWDYLSSSTENKYIVKYGERGGYWDIDESGTVFQKTPEGLTDDLTVENYKYTYGMVGNSPLVLKDESIYIGKEEAFSTWYRDSMVDEVWDYLQTEYIPLRMVDTAELDERTFIENDLFEYLKNFTASSIMGGVDDAAWESHLSQLETLQYYDWIQWYQDYIDGNL